MEMDTASDSYPDGFPNDWSMAVVVLWRNIHTAQKGDRPPSLNIYCAHFQDRVPFREGIQVCTPYMWIIISGTFTLPGPRHADSKYTEPNGCLCCRLSLCSMNITQSYTNNFLSVSVSVSESGSVNSPLHGPHTDPIPIQIFFTVSMGTAPIAYVVLILLHVVFDIGRKYDMLRLKKRKTKEVW